jgi:head-tail adaptor
MSRPHLNRALVLEAPDRVADEAGGFVETWAGQGTIWAEVSARGGHDRSEAGMQVASVVYRIVLRAAPVGSVMRPVPGQRFRDGTRLFPVRAVAERGSDGRYLTCFCDEEVSA